VIEDDVAVGMMLGLLPRRQRVRCRGKREQRLALDRVEPGERLLLGGAVDPPARGLDTPHPDSLIRLVHIAKGAAREEIAFDVVDTALLHFPFVLGGPRPARRDEKLVVLGAFAVRALDDRIVERGLHDRRFQIVEDDPTRNATEPLERAAMAPQPRVDLLVEDELNVAVPTERQRHHERPRLAERVAHRIAQQPSVAEIDLPFLARIPLHAHARVRRPGLEVPDEPVHGAVAAREGMLLAQDVEDRAALHATLTQRDHVVPKRRHLRWDRRRGAHRQRRLQLRLQRRGVGQRPGEHIVVLRPRAILADGFTTHLQIAGNLAIGLAQLHASN
jgi:hypothetical protein